MEGKRGVFALPGNGSGTNRLGGWLNILAEAATGIDLMGNTVGGPSVNICLLPSRGRLAQGHVIYVLKN